MNIIGHVEWAGKFDEAIKEYRGAESDDARARAAQKLHDLGLSDGDVLYYANRSARRA